MDKTKAIHTTDRENKGLTYHRENKWLAYHRWRKEMVDYVSLKKKMGQELTYHRWTKLIKGLQTTGENRPRGSITEAENRQRAYTTGDNRGREQTEKRLMYQIEKTGKGHKEHTLHVSQYSVLEIAVILNSKLFACCFGSVRFDCFIMCLIKKWDKKHNMNCFHQILTL